MLEYRCYEVKRESEKASSHQKSSPVQTVLCHWAMTTGQPPAQMDLPHCMLNIEMTNVNEKTKDSGKYHHKHVGAHLFYSYRISLFVGGLN